MNQQTALYLVVGGAVALGLNGCAGANDDPAAADADFGVSSQELALGSHLTGVSDANFLASQAEFQQVEGVDEGLGPIFNEKACGTCHNLGATGGSGTQIERRFGLLKDGVFNSLSRHGGSLRQLFTLGAWKPGCSVPLEVEPSEANVHNVGRLSTPLFGLGLVDALPDSTFVNLAAGESSATRGRVNFVSVLFPDPGDSTQSISSTRAGRFGWKAGVATLIQFAADAYLNEMGITTQHCYKGTSITAFSTESAPNGIPVPLGCDDDAPPAPPGVPAGTDLSVGSCSGGRTAIEDNISKFTTFMKFLSPPPRGAVGATEQAGDAVYEKVGCHNCHSRKTFTTPASPANGVPGNFSFQPFSDFLIHDMGSLGDSIGDAGMAKPLEMRTALLWGLRFRKLFLHDGRTSDLATAISAHAGQGAAAASAFRALGSSDRTNLLAYLKSL